MTTEIVESPQQGSDLVVHQGADLVPARSTSSLVQLTAPMEDIVDAQRQYQAVCSALLDENDIQVIGKKEFKKKSAWRKLGVAFGVSTQILSTTHERNERGRIIRTEVVARATAPNGRFAEGIGACDLYERCCDPGTCTKLEFWEDSGKPTGHTHCTEWPCKTAHFSNPQHDIPATAATRATNRAAADLFGMGEVSAEEMSETSREPVERTGNAHQAARSSKPISDGQIKFVNLLFARTGRDLWDLKDRIGREVPVTTELTMDEAKTIIDFLKPIMDGAPDPDRESGAITEPERRSTANPAPKATEPATVTGAANSGQLRAIGSLLKESKAPLTEYALRVSLIIHREIEDVAELTADEAGFVIETLQAALTPEGEERAF